MSFELGFPNEAWNYKLSSLMVPIPGTDKVILVHHDRGKYSVVSQGNWEDADTIIMAAAVVHDLINNYDTTGGNRAEEQANTTA